MSTVANEAKLILDTDSLNSKTGMVLRNVKNIQGLAKLASRKSIMTMAAPGMYQYPLIASNGIEIDYLMAIVKAYQLTYASSVATAYSLNPSFDRGDFPTLSDYVQKFHQNDPNLLSGNVDVAAKTLGVSLNSATELVNVDGMDFVVESGTISKDFTDAELSALNVEAWDRTEDSLIMESLNDMYKPYTRTERILKEKIDLIKKTNAEKANEGSIFDTRDGEEYKDVNGIAMAVPSTKIDRGILSEINDKVGGYSGNPNKYNATGLKQKGHNQVVRNNQLEALEPTIVNIQLTAYGGKDATGAGTQSAHNVTLGVKVMPRVISSNLMIASMAEAVQDSHFIFKFLNFTKGEKKTLDFILGISSSKAKALKKNAKNEVQWLQQNKKRKKLHLFGKALNNDVLPTTSVVLTTYEASKIKDLCGVDLTQMREAVKLMNKYFLLSLAIYDTEQNTLKVLFDCDTEWAYTTIGQLKANVNKVTDVLNDNEIRKLLGRR